MLKDLLRRTPSNMNMKKGRGEEPDVLKTLWAKCGKCQELIYRDDVKANYYACPKCGAYFRLNAKRRMRMIVDREVSLPGTRIFRLRIRCSLRDMKRSWKPAAKRPDCMRES